jgi:phage terminase small subunit
MAKRKATDKQKRFVKEYAKDLNATQAAIRSGYSSATAHVIGNRLIKRSLVTDEIQENLKGQVEKIDVNVQRILEEIAAIAFADIRTVMSWTDTGVAFVDSNKIPEGVSRAISEISETVTDSGGTRKLKMHDKLKALELLGRYAGMFKETIEVTAKPFHERIVEQIEEQKQKILEAKKDDK